MALSIDDSIIILGAGRSGTSIMGKIIENIPNTKGINETGGLIFGTYLGAEESWYEPDYEAKYRRTDSVNENRGIKAIHDLYKYHLNINSDNPASNWVQKPAGLPGILNAASQKITKEDIVDFPITYYWKVFNNVFNNAKYIIMMRNPWEVVLSRNIRNGFNQSGMWRHILDIHAVLLSAPKNAEFVFFDDLLRNPNEVIGNLCKNLNLNHPSNLEKIMSKKVVPTPYPDNHEDLKNNMEDIPQEVWEKKWIIERLWNEKGKTFQSFNRNYIFFK